MSRFRDGLYFFEHDAPLGGVLSTPEEPVWSADTICWGTCHVCKLPGWRLYVTKPDGRYNKWTPSLKAYDNNGNATGRRVDLAMSYATPDEAKRAALAAYAPMAPANPEPPLSSEAKLFIACLDTLPVECIAPQAVHALAEFAVARQTSFRRWQADVKTVVVGTLSKEDLLRLNAEEHTTGWREPDMKHELTSVAVLILNDEAQRLVRRIRTRPGV